MTKIPHQHFLGPTLQVCESLERGICLLQRLRPLQEEHLEPLGRLAGGGLRRRRVRQGRRRESSAGKVRFEDPAKIAVVSQGRVKGDPFYSSEGPQLGAEGGGGGGGEAPAREWEREDRGLLHQPPVITDR